MEEGKHLETQSLNVCILVFINHCFRVLVLSCRMQCYCFVLTAEWGTEDIEEWTGAVCKCIRSILAVGQFHSFQVNICSGQYNSRVTL